MPMKCQLQNFAKLSCHVQSLVAIHMPGIEFLFIRIFNRIWNMRENSLAHWVPVGSVNNLNYAAVEPKTVWALSWTQYIPWFCYALFLALISSLSNHVMHTHILHGPKLSWIGCIQFAKNPKDLWIYARLKWFSNYVFVSQYTNIIYQCMLYCIPILRSVSRECLMSILILHEPSVRIIKSIPIQVESGPMAKSLGLLLLF